MSFANKYFERVRTFAKFEHPTADNPQIIVIIPIFNEHNILKTVEHLFTNKVNFKVHLIFMINSAENTRKEIIIQNKKSEKQLLEYLHKNENENIKYSVINIENLPAKYHGAGLARKIAMDEALRIFDKFNNPDGIIVSLDADTLVESNYLQAIKQYFERNKVCGANIAFEHPSEGTEFSKEIYEAVSIYEIYLRYYVEALRISGFPYAYHTIGSAFCVKANTYAKTGGMVLNRSGEDFYFIQKLFSSCKYGEIKDTTVHPSPRITDRVIFGTGVAVNEIIKKYNFEYPTYKYEAFLELKNLFANLPLFYNNRFDFSNTISNELKAYLTAENYKVRIKEIYDNTSNFSTFEKRFYQWFNALKVLKFLNYIHKEKYKKNSVTEEAKKLCKICYKADLTSNKKILYFLRKIQNN